MRIQSVWQWLLASCLFSTMVCVAAAEPAPALTIFAQRFLADHPAVQAARADLQRAIAQARAVGQPLYNPEIEIEYEDSADVTRTLGLTQTLDWSGKRRARADVGQAALHVARAQFDATRQRLLGELLGDLVKVRTANESASLSQHRQALLERFLQLAERRFAAGDIGQTDVELARLALFEARMQAVSLMAEASGAESRLYSLVQLPPSGWPALPQPPSDLPQFEADEWLKSRPSLRQAAAEGVLARASVNSAQRDRRADPTIGLRGGQEGNDTLVGIMVSVPLLVRNGYYAEVDAANADAIRAEQGYQDLLRRGKGELQAAGQRFHLLSETLADWNAKGEASLQGRIDVLRRLWDSGEIGTTEYLVQVQQTLDTQASAIALRASTWNAWVAWLDAAGQIESWLGLTARELP